MSNDLHTLSGAYAVDALSAEEAQQFATHLEQCQACRDEVRELQDAAARMGAAEAATPPPALRARVLAAADKMPQLPPKTTPITAARSKRWTARTVGVAAAVILVVTGAFAVSRLQDRNEPPVASESVSQVFKASDAHTATVETANGGRLRVATSKESGQMALATKGLPRLDNRTYQMWAIRDGRTTSVGLIDDPSAGKVMPIPPPGTKVAITIEPTGGSQQPTHHPIVEMDPEAV
jgi:anti-sigma-K factor RskA